MEVPEATEPESEIVERSVHGLVAEHERIAGHDRVVVHDEGGGYREAQQDRKA